MLDEELVDPLRVHDPLGQGELVDRLVRVQAHAERDVPELQVEVDDDGPLAGFL